MDSQARFRRVVEAPTGEVMTLLDETGHDVHVAQGRDGGLLIADSSEPSHVLEVRRDEVLDSVLDRRPSNRVWEQAFLEFSANGPIPSASRVEVSVADGPFQRGWSALLAALAPPYQRGRLLAACRRLELRAVFERFGLGAWYLWCLLGAILVLSLTWMGEIRWALGAGSFLLVGVALLHHLQTRSLRDDWRRRSVGLSNLRLPWCYSHWSEARATARWLCARPTEIAAVWYFSRSLRRCETRRRGRDVRAQTGGLVAMLVLLAGGATVHADQVDLADPALVLRVHGSAGPDLGVNGVPVAGDGDLDADGRSDVAVAHMMAFEERGEVSVLLGGGVVAGAVDLGDPLAEVVKIQGSASMEATGSEIWMADVTGDGVSDLLIGRQNWSDPASSLWGAGALTILPGGPHWRAAVGQVWALESMPAGVPWTTLTGVELGGRLGIWVRAGDIDGDGTADIAVAADQRSQGSDMHVGVVWLLQGGAALNDGGQLAIDDAALMGSRTMVRPPPGSAEHHAGSTLFVGSLDGDAYAEIGIASALNRMSASLQPAGAGVTTHQAGGVSGGRVYVVWGEDVRTWPAEHVLGTGLGTIFNGNFGEHLYFGEEIYSGGDVDGDGVGDLAIGDLTANRSGDPQRFLSGVVEVLYSDPGNWHGATIEMASPPAWLRATTIAGPETLAYGGDSVVVDDFNDDELADVALSSPHGDGLGRGECGLVHVLFGEPGGLASFVDLASASGPGVSEIVGAEPHDTLGYSLAPAGDFDSDGYRDLVTNEMTGDGFGGAPVRVGNVDVVSGAAISGEPVGPMDEIFLDGFESGDTSSWSGGSP